MVVHAALGQKAESIVILDVRKKFPLADEFVVMTVDSARQARAVVEAVDEELSRRGEGPPLSVEGEQEGEWVLIDLGEIVVHVFQEAVRAYYDIEGLWLEAPRYRVEETPRGVALLPQSIAAAPRAGGRPRKARP